MLYQDDFQRFLILATIKLNARPEQLYVPFYKQWRTSHELRPTSEFNCMQQECRGTIRSQPDTRIGTWASAHERYCVRS